MEEAVQFKFHGRDEAIDIINTGGKLVSYLAGQSAECPLIGSEIEFTKELGRGAFGAAYLLKIKGMGAKEYVAKKLEFRDSVHKASMFGVKKATTLGKLAKSAKKYLNDDISPDILIAINGGDPNIPINPKSKIYVSEEYMHSGCLTKSKNRYKHFVGNGVTIIPAGSYLCSDAQYSEYIVGILCGDLYRKGISANFFDVFGFATCVDPPDPDEDYGDEEGDEDYNGGRMVNQYVFMEKIDKTLRGIEKLVFEKQTPPEKFKKFVPNVLLIQTLHAIATYQDAYKLQHNDLHGDNVFIELIRHNTMFNGQKLHGADWFHYQIGGVDLYLPWIPFIVKIGDFGLSVKYSKRIVGDKLALETGYDQDDGDGPWIPNWYSLCYDMVFITRIFFVENPGNKFIMKIFAKMLKIGIKPLTFEGLYKFVDMIFEAGGKTRPKMDYVLHLDSETSPLKILTDPKLLGKYMKKPTEGKIVTLGTI